MIMEKLFTFIILKPDTLQRNLVTPVLKMLTSQGVVIEAQQEVIVARQTILAHYQEVIDKLNLPHFKQAILDVFEHQKVIIIKASAKGQDPVTLVRTLIGPTDPAKADKSTIRGYYADDTLAASIAEKRMLRNLIHASDSPENAVKEASLWFKS
jgi:nucleoside-diphosphate kinase